MGDLYEYIIHCGRAAGLIAAASLAREFFKHRDRRHLELFLAVAAFSLTIWLSALGLTAIATTLVWLRPFLMLRVLSQVRDVPLLAYAPGVAYFGIRLYRRNLADSLTLAAVSDALAAGVFIYAAATLWRESARTRGVTAGRLRLATAAACLMSFDDVFGVASRWLPWLTQPAGTLNEIEVALDGLLLYLAFAPPTWLRSRWHRREEGRYLVQAGAKPLEMRATSVPQDLAAAAARSIPSESVLVALRDRPDVTSPLHILASSTPGLVGMDVSAAGGLLGRSSRAGDGIVGTVSDCEPPLNARLADFGREVLVAPVNASSQDWGVVALVRHRGSLFPEDDLRQLQVLARHAAATLDHAHLVAEQRERDRRAAERRVQEIESRVALMLESIRDYALLVIDDDGAVVGWQPGAQQLFGYDDAEMRGRSIAPLFGLTDVELRLRLDEARSRGRIEFEGACQRKDATAFTGQTVIRRLVFEGAPVNGFVAVTRDVTDRRLLEERLRHSEKLEAVGLLAGGVAHDFNNLLAAIVGYAGIVQLNLDAADPNQPHIEEIQVVAERAAALTEQLLAFSRRQALQTAVVDLSAFVADVVPILQAHVGPHVKVAHELGDVWPISVDPSQIDRVLLNLATNAREAMPEGGTLTIRTRNVLLDETGSRGEVAPGNYVMLEVADTGTGMDDATLARIFEPFYSTREFGRGLGLSAVYGIVKQMHGLVTAESTPGHGATLRVCFPQSDASVRPAAAAPSPGAAASLAAAGSLLLVEDDDSVRSFLRQLLEREGFRVMAAPDQASAIQLVAGASDPISLVITDVLMPGGGGPQLVEAIEQIRPGVPTLYISGHLDAAQIAGLRVPAHFLQKPFSSDELLSRVRQIVPPAS